jgi:hypothetical protein
MADASSRQGTTTTIHGEAVIGEIIRQGFRYTRRDGPVGSG